MEQQNKSQCEKISLDCDNWEYYVEGGQHIILKKKQINYGSEINEQGCERLLRINKIDLKILKNIDSKSDEDKLQNHKEIEDFHYYINQILIDNLFKDLQIKDTLLIPEVIQNDNLEITTFLQQISKQIEQIRDQSRCGKIIDVTSNIDIMENISQQLNINDHIQPESQFIIEFKPKCPFYNKYANRDIDNYTKQSQLTINTELQKCTKLDLILLQEIQNKKLDKKMGYNPLQIFSDKEEVIYSELQKLQKDPWKLYKEKNIIQKDNKNEIVSQRMLQIISQELKNSQIFDYIQRVQQLFDSDFSCLDILQEVFNSKFQELKSIDKEQIIKICQEFKEEIEKQQFQYEIEVQELKNQYAKNCNNIDMYLSIKLILRVLISIAFRDLSILVNIGQLKENKKVEEEQKTIIVLQENGYKYEDKDKIFYKIKIIDYDLKPFKKLKEYRIQDLKLLEVMLQDQLNK